jgi:hypothetical protein
MAQMDISTLGYFTPIFSFLFVFVLMYALLAKTKLLGDNKFVHLITSFVIAIIFSLISSVRQYVESVVPWFAVLIVALFFILLIIGFSQKKMEDMMKPGLAWIFIVLLIVIFIVAAVKIFGSSLTPAYNNFREFIGNNGWFGGIVLLIVAILASWVLTKK